jgi:ParB-like chromosome segregation protein Spo0J
VNHPIDNIQWIDVDLLDANDYNPNVVIGPEMRLLKLSLLKQGWIQPVLVAETANGRYLIIDGFHRSTLAKVDEDLRAKFGTAVPCAVLDITDAERKMLTVRINRAKGSHVAARMHELVTSLVRDHAVPIPQLCEELGADRSEIDLLLQESVFTKLEIPDHAYSRAWVPADRSGKRPKTA